MEPSDSTRTSIRLSPYEIIRDIVVDDSLDPDTPITESALAERLGISRTPIREALKLLESDGLLERSGRGLRIRQRSSEEILEIYEARVVLEAAAARGAALRRTDFDLSRLHAIHKTMCELESDGLAVRISWNARFHETLWISSHNATIQELMKRLMIQLRRYPQSSLGDPARWAVVLKEHAALIDALSARDADLCASIANSHGAGALETRLRVYARPSQEI